MSSPSPISTSRVLTALRIFCLVLVGLHLAAPLFTEANAWGVWPYTYLPRGWQLLLAALAVLTILPNTAAAILRQRDARVLREAALQLDSGDDVTIRILNCMADDLENGK